MEQYQDRLDDVKDGAWTFTENITDLNCRDGGTGAMACGVIEVAIRRREEDGRAGDIPLRDKAMRGYGKTQEGNKCQGS